MIVYVDMDDTLCQFSEAHAMELQRNPSIKFPQSQYGFFERLLPIKNAVESMNLLAEASEYDPYILTAPSTRNPLCYTEKRVWIEKHLGYHFVKKLIISPNKGLLKGDLLIDDNISGKGQENFEGKIFQFGSLQFPDWLAILNELKLEF